MKVDELIKCEPYLSCYEEGYEQGKRDAVDEFLKRFEDEGDWIEIDRYYLEKIAEQIKGE